MRPFAAEPLRAWSSSTRGFFAVKDNGRAGFNEVWGIINLKSSAPAADLAKLRDVVDAHCPVRESMPVDLRLETERATQAARCTRQPRAIAAGIGPRRPS